MSTLLITSIIVGSVVLYAAVGITISAVLLARTKIKKDDAYAWGGFWGFVPVVMPILGVLAGIGWLCGKAHQRLLARLTRPASDDLPVARVVERKP